MHSSSSKTFVAIACGGTGGHLFPGMAVGHELVRRGCHVALLVSTKEIDQQAVQSVRDMEVITVPAVSMGRGGTLGFALGFWKSYRQCRKIFSSKQPAMVLGMGGFASAPVVLAGRSSGAKTFLHDSNAIPGRANRWLAHVVDYPFVGFPEAVRHLAHQKITVTGTPVRQEFQPMVPASCRVALGLEAERPTLLIMGGSQGASGINDLVLRSLDRLRDFQCIHLTGPTDFEKVRQAYAAASIKAMVRPFFTEMEMVLGAASVAISRSGASSLAEFAAMQVPVVLIPFPQAADNHQLANANAYVRTGAARLLEQKAATPEGLEKILREIQQPSVQEPMKQALKAWHAPEAAEQIAARMMHLTGAVAVSPDGSAAIRPQWHTVS